jgi:hypothetical protein
MQDGCRKHTMAAQQHTSAQGKSCRVADRPFSSARAPAHASTATCQHRMLALASQQSACKGVLLSQGTCRKHQHASTATRQHCVHAPCVPAGWLSGHAPLPEHLQGTTHCQHINLSAQNAVMHLTWQLFTSTPCGHDRIKDRKTAAAHEAQPRISAAQPCTINATSSCNH